MPTPGSNSQNGSQGNPRSLGTIDVGPGTPIYKGADGQTYQYVGTNAAGQWIPQTDHPPANTPNNGTPNGGTPNAGGGGAGQAGGSSNSGIVASASGMIGKSKTLVVVGTALAIAGAYYAGLVALPLAIGLLVLLAGLDIALGGVTKGVESVEDWWRGVDKDGKPVPGSPFAPGGLLAKFASGYLGDFVIAIAIGGIVYSVSHRRGSEKIEITQGRRENPPRRRGRRRRRRLQIN
jgi:hypothetical protein